MSPTESCVSLCDINASHGVELTGTGAQDRGLKYKCPPGWGQDYSSRRKGDYTVYFVQVENVCESTQCVLTLTFVWTIEVESLIKNTIFVNLCFDVFVVVGFIRWRWRQRKHQLSPANQRSFKVGGRYCPIFSFLRKNWRCISTNSWTT